MIKIDLVTGFLGSGKTTFIKIYAEYLIRSGHRVGIVVNDFGPVNIDRILLGELEGENCTVEMVTTGLNDDSEAHSRRFKTKLISLKMQGFDRVIVEPSGIYDIHEFFDCLNDDPLYDWYEPGSVITLVDADLEDDLAFESEHYLASQLSSAGIVLFSRCDMVSADMIDKTKGRINDILEKIGGVKLSRDIIAKDFSEYDNEILKKISDSGYVGEGRIKPLDDAKEHFHTAFYTDFQYSSIEELKSGISELMTEYKEGKVLRIKGFVNIEGISYEINASHNGIRIIRCSMLLQQIIIIISIK